MNYTKEQAERMIRDYNIFLNLSTEITYDDIRFLDHKFPKKVSGWYRTMGNADWLVYHDFETGITYGFGTFGKWFKLQDVLQYNLEDDYLATPQEVKQRLIEEAKRRYKIGDVVKSFRSGDNVKIHNLTMYLGCNNELLCGGLSIFNNGKWAEIIEQPETELSRTIKKAEKIVEKLNHLLYLHHS